MHQIICKIGPFTVYAYGFMLAVAFFIGSNLAAKEAKRQRINPDTIFNLLFIAFISGIIGARIFYVIENVNYYIKNPVEIVMLQHGGLSWFGGLILGVLCGTIYLRSKNLPIYKTFDLIVPFVALAQGIGRVGCLLNGCCFGKVSKFGFYFDLHRSFLVPTQLISSLILIFIFVTLRILASSRHKDGEIFLTYLLLYSAKRFFIEFLRGDNEVIFLGLTLFQVISIIIFCLSLLKLASIKRSKN